MCTLMETKRIMLTFFYGLQWMENQYCLDFNVKTLRISISFVYLFALRTYAAEINKEWEKSTNLKFKAQRCDYLFFVNPQATKKNYPYGLLHHSLVPGELGEYCFLLDGRGIIPHFWWIATVEYSKKKQ